MSDEMIPLTKVDLSGSEMDRISNVLKSGQLVQANTVREFEQLLQKRVDVDHAIACSSGTLAIQLSLKALNIGPGDDVVMSDFCFPSVAAAILSVGANCVLCDVAPDCFNAGVEQINAVLTPQTKAVIVVHQFGIPAGAKALVEQLSVPVIEDAACALGAVDDGRACGTWGDFGCYSFHPRKIMTTAEGGLVVTAHEAFMERLRMLRNHGMVRLEHAVEFNDVGMSGRMTEIHAAIGLAQLERLDDQIEGRNRSAALYRAALENVSGVFTNHETWHAGRVYQSMVVRIRPPWNRDVVINELRRRGIQSTLGTYAIHRQAPFVSRCQRPSNGLAESNRAQEESLTLPLWADMEESTVARVVDALCEVLC